MCRVIAHIVSREVGVYSVDLCYLFEDRYDPVYEDSGTSISQGDLL